MCIRNVHGGLVNPLIKTQNWSLNEFKTIMSREILDQISEYYYCGNFGDPILNNDLIEMCRYTTQNAPHLKVSVHTNGGARTTDWWSSLANALPPDHCVHFALDGLEDTHHLYRVGTDFNKIIENAKAFISAGGRAEWVFLSFKHNEHQIDAAKEMAKQLGFEKFSHKATSRFLEKPWFDVLDKTGNVLYKLEPPAEHKITFVDPKIIKSYRSVVETAVISCKVQQDKSLYIDAFKNMWPCCWIGALPYSYSTPTDLIHTYQTDQTAVINQLIEYIGGYEAIDLTKRSVKDVLEDARWSTVWQEYWDKKLLATCAKTCGSFPQKILTRQEDQFLKVENFNG
jgi:hypothetical protein